jgi:hypothetical protein
MSAGLIRYLCLGCGLVLALPPAWCCYVPQQSMPQASEPARACCCCHHEPTPQPAAPKLPPPGRCPYYDHHTTVPAKPAIGPAFAVPVVLFASHASAVHLSLAAVEHPRGPSRSVHLLQCVWLC